MNVLDLFSGIGGFSLGLERAGMRTVAFCEIDPFARLVLAKHWPDVPCYNDVRTLTSDGLRADGINTIDVITGGFPCQDISEAGKRRGLGEGTRSGLWGEIIRIAGELRPRYLIVENVADLLVGPSEQPGQWFGRVLGDLASLGFDAEWENIPAAAVGAPHRRERVWIVAYDPKNGNSQFPKAYRRAHTPGPERAVITDKFPGILGRARAFIRPFASEPEMGRMVHGVPRQLGELGSLGNSVIPQIPEIIGRAIMRAA